MDSYPPESQRMDFAGHLEELRRRIVICLIFFAAMSAVLFSQGYALMAILEAPARHLIKEFIFLDPLEAFAAYFKVVLFSAAALSFPVLLYEAWTFLSPALTRHVRRAVLFWILLSFVCFYGGIAFAYSVLLPAALNFLLAFGTGIARPEISISRYISFASVIVFAGGCIFQIPVVMGLLTEAGVLQSGMLAASRKYAILGMVVAAAILSPTQDVFNLMLFAVPMVILYEAGIGLSWIVSQRKKNASQRG